MSSPEEFFDKYGRTFYYDPEEPPPWDDQDVPPDNGHGGTHTPAGITFWKDFDKRIIKPTLIKGAFYKGETSALVGPPGGGKSALHATTAIAVASGTPWYGFRTKERCAVVIFAFERGDLVRRRFHAHQLRDNLPDLPIAVRSQITDTLNPKCVSEFFVPTIKAVEDHYGIGVGFIVIDTWNKGIAFGGGDEDKARDQNRALANMRRLHELQDLHIAIVCHTGKDESRGSRGSNAMPGDMDMQTQIRIEESDVKIVTTTKANDAPLGELLRFKLQPYEVGTDEDGDPQQIWIASSEIISPVAGSAIEEKRARKKMTGAAKAFRNAITEALDAYGRDTTTYGNAVRAVSVAHVRDAFFRKHVVSTDKEGAAEAKRKAFDRELKRGAPQGYGSGEIDGVDCIWRPTP